MDDLISRQAAIDAVRAYLSDCCVEDGDYHASGIEYELNDLPPAQPEPLTDKEQRIFLAAMGREEKVCKHKDSLVRVCHEIERKVKGALWTI